MDDWSIHFLGGVSVSLERKMIGSDAFLDGGQIASANRKRADALR